MEIWDGGMKRKEKRKEERGKKAEVKRGDGGENKCEG